jgi:uncharacterized repeat protein (TIGR03843 family)
MDPIADKTFIIKALQEGQLDLQGQFMLGSNYTFLAQLAFLDQVFPVVYKPARGEMPLWDFPAHTLAKREAAAFEVGEGLGWNLVPPTIFRKQGPLGPGSLQFFILHNPEEHYFTFSDDEKQQLRQTVVFDLLINNADRKGGHILRDNENRFWLIDHGVCFHTDDKLRTIIWDFAGEPIPNDLVFSLQTLVDKLAKADSNTYQNLRQLLNKSELAALLRRARNIVADAVFPNPTQARRFYPWPPV